VAFDSWVVKESDAASWRMSRAVHRDSAGSLSGDGA